MSEPGVVNRAGGPIRQPRPEAGQMYPASITINVNVIDRCTRSDEVKTMEIENQNPNPGGKGPVNPEWIKWLKRFPLGRILIEILDKLD